MKDNYTRFVDQETADGLDIPVEHWEIDFPTKECQDGVAIYTYWQNRGRNEQK